MQAVEGFSEGHIWTISKSALTNKGEVRGLKPCRTSNFLSRRVYRRKSPCGTFERGNCAPGITPTTSRVEEKEVEQLGNVEGLFDTALQDADELIGVL